MEEAPYLRNENSKSTEERRGTRVNASEPKVVNMNPTCRRPETLCSVASGGHGTWKDTIEVR